MNKLSVNLLCSNSKQIAKSSVFSRLYSDYESDQIVISNKEYLTGVFPTITAPFKRDANESISWKDLQKNLIRWSSIPFTGYALHGYFGEYPYLNEEERLDLVKMVKNVVGNRKTIIAGCSSESLKKTIKICESIKNAGANYALLFTPHYYKKQMSYSAILEYFTKVADESPLPILLHNIPSVTYIDLPGELILDLAQHPNIVGLKECSHNIAKIACVVEQIKGQANNDFTVLAGAASFLLDALRVGANGSICATANVLGPQLIEICNLYKLQVELDNSKENKLLKKEYNDKAQTIQNKLIQPDLAIGEVYGVAGLKAALDAYGYYGGPCRLPLIELNEKELAELRSLFEQNGFSWSSTPKSESEVSVPMSY